MKMLECSFSRQTTDPETREYVFKEKLWWGGKVKSVEGVNLVRVVRTGKRKSLEGNFTILYVLSLSVRLPLIGQAMMNVKYLNRSVPYLVIENIFRIIIAIYWWRDMTGNTTVETHEDKLQVICLCGLHFRVLFI